MEANNTIPFNKPFNCLDPLKYSWHTLKKEWKPFVLAFLSLGPIYILCIIICTAFLPPFYNILFKNGAISFELAATSFKFTKAAPITLFLINIFGLIPYAITLIGFSALALQTYANKPISLKNIYSSLFYLMPLIAAIIFYQIIYTYLPAIFDTLPISYAIKIIFSILIEIANFLFYVLLSFYVFFIIEQKSTIIESLKQSYALTCKHIKLLTISNLTVFLFLIISFLLSASIISIPFYFIRMYHLFNDYQFNIVTTSIGTLFFFFFLFILFTISTLSRVYMYKKLLEYKSVIKEETI